MAGWGHTSHGGSASNLLRSVNVEMIGKEQCKAAYGKSAITAQMICAGTREGGRDACQVGEVKALISPWYLLTSFDISYLSDDTFLTQGDSGGGLVVRSDDGSWILPGIVSFGKGCGDRRYPGVYTRSRFNGLHLILTKYISSSFRIYFIQGRQLPRLDISARKGLNNKNTSLSETPIPYLC